MTVYSINQRIFEQSNMTAASGKNAGDQAQEFADALMQARSTFGAAGTSSQVPASETVIANRLDRPKDDVRAATNSDARNDRGADRKVERSQPKTKADKADDKDQTQAEDSAQADDSADIQDDHGQDGKVQVKATAQKKVAAKPDQASESQANQAQSQMLADPQAAQAQVVQVQQTVQQVQETDVTAAQVQVIAQESQGKAQVKADGPKKAQTNQDLFGPGTAAAAAAKVAAQGDVEEEADSGFDLADAQAQDLAQSLDDTGAKLAVSVNVEGPQTVTTTTATAALSVQDVAAEPQDGAIRPANPFGPRPTQAQAVPEQAAQTAQVQNDAAEAQPFAAILAAQMEAGNDAPVQSAPSQNGVQGIGGIGAAQGTQATQKAAPTQAAQAPRPAKMPEPKEVMDQVNVEIAKQAKDGNDTITVSLKPVELGKIEIKLEVGQDGRVNTTVTADSRETLDVLKSDQKGLSKALQDAGLDPNGGQMTFNLRGEGQQQQTAGGQNQKRRSKLTVAAEIDAASAQAAQAAQARWSGRSSGVDVSV